MSRDNFFKDFVIEQLQDLEGITVRPMFDGFGIYQDNHFFGIIHRSSLYFKTNDTNRQDYIDAGMTPFTPSDKQTLKNYYQVPPEIIEDKQKLYEWVNKSVLTTTTPDYT